MKGLSWSWVATPPPLSEFHQQTSPELDTHVHLLHKKRVIEKTSVIRWQSRLFTVPKRDVPEGRLILDLSALNAFISCPSFRMLTMRDIRLLLPQHFWTVALDLTDGYWHIAVTPRKRPFLGFRYRDQNWRFRAMPFGLNVAPRIFTKLMAHAVKLMAEAGVWCLPYLDDLLIVSPTQEDCLAHREKAIGILKSLGWMLNDRKSRLQPAQVFDWLGFTFDLLSHTVQAAPDKRENLCLRLRSVVTSRYCSKRGLMQLQGLANWIGQFDPLVRLLLSRTRALLKIFRRRKLDAPFVLSPGMRLSLVKWLSFPSLPQALGNPSPTILIQTDASLQGWGFQINQTAFKGKFDTSMSYNINILELLTIWFSLLMVTEQ